MSPPVNLTGTPQSCPFTTWVPDDYKLTAVVTYMWPDPTVLVSGQLDVEHLDIEAGELVGSGSA
jgi:hypothetical protein